MKTTTIRFLLGTVAWLCVAGAAWGFPTWMGVYGAYATHDGGNPGTYTILMNQDYWGLHAEVGIQVAGSWTTHAMEYAGNADGNSLWRFHPGAALAEGTPVQYYFHGWDDWGGNIYANNGGLNYSFVAGPAAIEWIGASEQTPDAPSAGEDIRFWTQTWPQGAGQSGFALYLAGDAWAGIPLSKAGTTNGNDLWRGDLGRLAAGTEVTWLSGVEDGAGTTHYDNNLGSNYAFTVATGAPAAFFGGGYHWPVDGALDSDDDFWLNVFASPAQSLVAAHADFTVNGWLWERAPLSFWQMDGTNEWWHVNLGAMPPASRVFYRFDALDGTGDTLSFPAAGALQGATVAGSAADADADGLPDDWETFWFSGTSVTTAHTNPDADGLPSMPFDNWMERVAGTDPAVSNAVEELPLLWKPSLPQQGGILALSAAPEALVGLGFSSITAHFSGGATATLSLDADGRYSGTVWLPRTGSVCTIASFVAGNETDDNAGLGWSIPVAPVGEGEEADSDGDGMPDAWEAAHALDPFADDASADADDDGISNLAEYENGLDPQESTALTYWVVKTTNFPSYYEELEDCPLNAPEQFVTSFVVAGARPRPNSFVHDVTVSGVVDDNIAVDGTRINWARGPKAIPKRSVADSILNLQSGQFTLALWDWPSADYEGANIAQLGAPFYVEWEWGTPFFLSGPDFVRLGDTAQFTPTGAGGGPFALSVSGVGVTIDADGLLTATSPGVFTVTATDAASGCEIDKVVTVVQVQPIEIVDHSATGIGVGLATPPNTGICAAIKGTGDIILQATFFPDMSEDEVPDGFVSWTGGFPVPGHPLQRKVSKSEWSKTVVSLFVGEASETAQSMIVYVLGAVPTGSKRNGTSYQDNAKPRQTGLHGPDEATGSFSSEIEIEFAIKPDELLTDALAGLFKLGDISWDVSRDRKVREWYYESDDWHFSRDESNMWESDDDVDSDEDNFPWDGHGFLYGTDVTRGQAFGAITRLVIKLNMREWVRVGLGGALGKNGTICSDYYEWRSFRSVKRIGNCWMNDTTYGNALEEGNLYWGAEPPTY